MLAQQTPPHSVQARTPRMMQTAFSFAPLFIVHTAIQLHIFDHLADGGKTASELQSACHASPRGVEALLDALVGLEWLDKNGASYELNSESENLLVRNRPSYSGDIFQHFVHDILPAFQQLEAVVRTGKPPMARNRHDEGSGFFQNFVATLFPINYPAAKLLASKVNLDQWGQQAKVLDLGTGSGVWGIAVAQEHANAMISALDWPEVLQVTEQMAKRFGVGNRFSYVGGDLDEADFGEGVALALLGNILHSEGDARSRRLLRKTYKALAPGGTIAIAEFLIEPNRVSPLPAVLFNINMLVNTEAGRVYSFGEIQSWLKEAGFCNVRLIEMPGSSPLILADK